MTEAFASHCRNTTVVRLREGVDIVRSVEAHRHCLQVGRLEFPIPEGDLLLAFVSALKVGMTLEAALDLTAKHERSEIGAAFQGIMMRGFVQYEVPLEDAKVARVTSNGGSYIPDFAACSGGRELALAGDAFVKRIGKEWVVTRPRCRADIWLPGEAVGILADVATPSDICMQKTARPVLFALMESLGLIVAPDNPPDGISGLEFHEILFHRYSRKGEHARPSGAIYAGFASAKDNPFIQRSWGTTPVRLPETASVDAPYGKSVREFSAAPVALAQLGELLSMTARGIRAVEQFVDGKRVEILVRPYPSGGGLYELEIYMAAYRVEGLNVGFYHYNARDHSLVLVSNDEHQLRRLSIISSATMGMAPGPPIVFVIAARFERMTWKYRSLTYSVILKNVGVLMKTIYDALPQCGLGGCALGSGNTDLFEELTGLDWHEESSVGEFVIGVPQ